MTDDERGDDLASRAKMASLRLASVMLGRSSYTEEDCLDAVKEVTVFIQWIIDNLPLATPERVELLRKLAVREVIACMFGLVAAFCTGRAWPVGSTNPWPSSTEVASLSPIGIVS